MIRSGLFYYPCVVCKDTPVFSVTYKFFKKKQKIIFTYNVLY